MLQWSIRMKKIFLATAKNISYKFVRCCLETMWLTDLYAIYRLQLTIYEKLVHQKKVEK